MDFRKILMVTTVLFCLVLNNGVLAAGSVKSIGESLPPMACPEGTKEATDGCIPEVRFHSQPNMTLAAAQQLAAQRGWKMATRQQVRDAYKLIKLNVFAFAMLEDGSFAIPIQNDTNQFRAGLNFDAKGGNQGFLYVLKSAVESSVKIKLQAGLNLAQARQIASQNGWTLATPDQVKSEWDAGRLDVYAFGMMSNGQFAVPVQSDKSNFRKGPNLGVKGGNQGFFYVESAGANKGTTRGTAIDYVPPPIAPGPSPISEAEMTKVMEWIALKVSAVRIPYCYRQSETRGAGKPLSNQCEAGLEEDNALCYPKCRAGYVGEGPVCWGSCPAGFKDIGAFCQKTKGSYGRGGGFIWKFGDKIGSLDGARARCEAQNGKGACEQNGAIIYPKCKAGFQAAGSNICNQQCPSGWADSGTGCTKPSYGRGAGKPFACQPGLEAGRETERSGLLCYPKCKNADFKGAGPVCWQQCPSQQPVACGAGCSTDAGTCASVVSDQVISPLMAAVSLATLGSAAAAANAAKAGKTGKAVADTAKASKAAIRLAKISKRFKGIIANAQDFIRVGVGGTKNLNKLKRAGKVVQYGSKLILITKEIAEMQSIYLAEFEDDFANQTSPEVAAEIERRFGPNGAKHVKRNWAINHFILMKEADNWATGQGIVSLASIADPTGIAGVVSAYMHPVCKKSAVFPQLNLQHRN